MKVYIEKIESYDLEKIRSFLLTLPFWSKLKGKKTILIKPNLLGAFPPEKAVTTHPVVLEALISILLEKDKKVWLGDSQGGTTSTKKVWQETGMQQLAEKFNIKLLNFSEGGVQETKSKKMIFNTSKYFWEADAVINVCKYKTHSLMSFTGAVKNLYGLIPGLKKSDYHKQNPDHISFGKVISNLYDSVHEKISFNLMDGILGMEGEGPSAGIPRNFGVMFASESAPALDYVASAMMGFDPQKLDYIISVLKIENLQTSEIEIDSEWKSFTFPNVKIQGVKTLVKILAYSPKFLKNLFRKWFQVYPDFRDGCRLCRVCVDSCPVQAMKLEKGDSHPIIDHSKCIKCMCCHELCPYGVVYVKKSFLAKFVVK
ncbi:MAG: DUF362 domain-containing protein [Candidatus Cloacimonetes bacterium]|nr:DUF362 domain-containing protein [Candidatus Cloacimonadota bacterium]MCF7814876.1 DUF362 domain-containing protein [Candidatus Cloacimonadota bacterium]MCF7868151.1 DUF362 domain-containing protein [Candidatus Cloacimonadota bacterium]MCF7884575.1 DUF362 domain-containing protein [Candidatus Cloacimonadota bacterium]